MNGSKVAYIQKKGKKSHFVFGEKIPTPERAVQDGGLSNLTEMAQIDTKRLKIKIRLRKTCGF